MKPVVCVRHQENAPLGIIQGVLEGQGIPWRYHDCWKDPSPPDLSDMSGLIVLGGAMNADETDDYPYLNGVRELVRDAVDQEQPVLGICLGAQIMARALGADVYPAPIREIGFVDVESTGSPDSLLEPFAPAAKVFQFHEDACSVPETAELIFKGHEVDVQAFRAGPRAYGVQFHFEVTMREIEEWCDEVPDLKGGWGMDKGEVLRQAQAELPRQQQAGREVARRFVELLG